MIIRHLILRQGRRVACSSASSWRRGYATTIDTIERSLESTFQETHRIKNELQETTMDLVPQMDNATTATQPSTDRNLIDQYHDYMHQRKRIGSLGSKVSTGFVPSALIQHPPAPSDITLELLMAAQAHLGHATALWNPMNSRWIFGIRQGIHIIGLEHTASHLRRACRVVEGVAERAGLILFVGTKRGHARIVVEAAKRAKGYHLFDRWRAGAITNRLSMLGGFDLQAVDPLDRPLDGFTEELLERPPVTPDLVVCLNPKENYVLLHECGLASIPTIGVIDTDADPTWVTYPIPANDDSLRCMQIVAGALSVAGETGQNKRLAKAREGKVTYNPVNMEKERIKAPGKGTEH